ncbi:hypothetical protein [Streptomyces nigrescens]|uniref:hypothetical protein n=1 Tax=Streptomyces nigrescens TaxID=1920 RepID=UPI003818EBB6
MNEERRDRYAAAMFERANPGFRWVDLQDGLPDQDHWRDEAEAAMAVADEEIRQLHIGIEGGYQSSVKALADENGRLRAELERSKAAHRAVWAKHQERGTRIFELLGENGRLRAELEDVRKDAEFFKGWADGNGHRLTEAQATIERVRAVLDNEEITALEIYYAIRTALDGTS